MKSLFCSIIIIMLFTTAVCHAGYLDEIKKSIGISSEKGVDEDTATSGIKEALSIGTKNAVTDVSKIDGYLANQAIKILMPEKLQKVADVLRKVGYQKQIDDFIISMNRSAEKAAPKATSYFIDAIKEMSFDDARKILNGGDTSATEYFRTKTSDKLYDAFKPIISSSMNDVGTTKAYKDIMGKYTSLPFMKAESFDLDHYVTVRAMDGIFYMVAQEEKKIRTDPAARVTDLLKKVFGK